MSKEEEYYTLLSKVDGHIDKRVKDYVSQLEGQVKTQKDFIKELRTELIIQEEKYNDEILCLVDWLDVMKLKTKILKGDKL